MEITRVPFVVHSFDADAFGCLSPTALAGYLQEAAGRSADALGFGLSELNKKGLTWVLARQRMVLDDAIRFGETLTVETWPSGLDRMAALRDFRLLRDGQEIGRAITTWFALDLSTRRPVKPDQLVDGRLHAQTEHVLPLAVAPIASLGEASIERRFQVRFADIDVNLHVTNSSYVAWALEAVDEASWRGERLAELDVQFLAEGRLDAFVHSRSAPDGSHSRLHSITREDDGKELARLRTTWMPRR